MSFGNGGGQSRGRTRPNKGGGWVCNASWRVIYRYRGRDRDSRVSVCTDVMGSMPAGYGESTGVVVTAILENLSSAEQYITTKKENN